MKSDYNPPLSSRLAAAAVLLVWAGILLAASQAGTMRLWGLNYLAFTPPNVIWWFAALAGIALLLVLYPGSVRVFRSPRSFSQNTIPWNYGLLMALAVGIAGWLLHARLGLLGDGIMRASDALQISTPIPSELLPSALSMLLTRYCPAGWGIDGFNALRIVSVASGVLLTLGLCWLAPKAEVKRPYWFIFWILTFGSFRLFAGYIESYAPAAAFAVLWTLAMLAYRKGNANALTVIIVWLCAFLSHVTMIVLAPATLFVLAWKRDRHRPAWGPPLAFLVLAAALGTYVGMRVEALQTGQAGAGTGYILLPLVARPPYDYGILSPAHLGDMLNQLALLVPSFLVAVIAFKIGGWLGHGTKTNTSQGDNQRRQDILLWTFMAGVPAIASLLIDPKLGWSRDWDLFTLFFAPAMTGAAVWLASLEASPLRRMAASVAVLSCGLWLVFSVNADSEQSRYEALLEIDPVRADYGYEILALYYRQTDRPLGEIAAYMKALKVTDNVRYRANIAAAYAKAGRNDDAIEWYREILAQDSLLDPAICGMSITLMTAGQYTEALPYARKALANSPEDPGRHFILGSILSRLHEFEEALPHLEFAARARPEDIDYLNPLGGCYLQLRRYMEARTVWHQVMKIAPDFAPAWLNLAHLELFTGHFDEARRVLSEYERLVPAAERRPEARSIADSLTKSGH